MIVPMMKYSFILYYKDYEAFLARLQELGLVDITVSEWEPTDTEKILLTDIDHQREAMPVLSKRLKNPDRKKVEPFGTPQETLAQYVSATAEIERLEAEIAKTEKEIDDLQPWGDFSKTDLEQLGKAGIRLHFFTASTKDFNLRLEEWEKIHAVEKIAESKGLVYFVVVTGPDTPHVEINATEIKMPAYTWHERKVHLKSLEREVEAQEDILERAAEGTEALDEYGKEMRGEFHLSQVNTSAPREAEGALVLMEGFAPAEDQAKVDAFLETDETAYSIKSEAENEDDPPVKLKNNRFARLFEVIGDFYSLPKYGTLDMTPYFAPFYMIFFGFCLADAGFGALYLIAAIIARFKLPKKMQSLVSLIMCLAISTIFFGLLTGNAFGIQLAEQPLFSGIHKYMVSTEQLFPLSIAVGMFHILYAMAIKVYATIRFQGFKYALSTLGWMIVIVSLLLAFGSEYIGISYSFTSVPFWIVTGIGLFLMLFMNSPGKNPLVNFGSGLWETFNNVTGLLGDVLSYIRLFALGLSGGILSLVFNKLAMEMSPDIIVVKQLVMIIILGIGQGLTLFMSTLSAFVHSLRLTFVEFYKNSGFVEGGRAYNPLKKEE